MQKKNLACGAKKLILSLWCKEIYPQIVVQKNHKFIQPRYDLHLFIFTFIQTKMPQPDSENFCLKWNDFVENVTTSFAQLHNNKDFSDVTLACGDGPQINAHRIVLASGSLMFKALFEQNLMEKPVIFMRGVKSDQLTSIVDFLYKGETNIEQDNLNEFLALAEDLQLKGLTQAGEKVVDSSEAEEIKRLASKHSRQQKISSIDKTHKVWGENQKVLNTEVENGQLDSQKGPSGILSVIQDFQTLKTAAKSGVTFQDGFDHMEIEIGKLMEKVDGKGWMCISCGKNDQKINIKKHIEGHHIERGDHYCNFCGKHCRSRNALQKHVSMNHRELNL